MLLFAMGCVQGNDSMRLAAAVVFDRTFSPIAAGRATVTAAQAAIITDTMGAEVESTHVGDDVNYGFDMSIVRSAPMVDMIPQLVAKTKRAMRCDRASIFMINEERTECAPPMPRVHVASGQEPSTAICDARTERQAPVTCTALVSAFLVSASLWLLTHDHVRCSALVTPRLITILAQSVTQIVVPMNESSIAGECACRGNVINLKNVHDHPNFNAEIDRKSGCVLRRSRSLAIAHHIAEDSSNLTHPDTAFASNPHPCAHPHADTTRSMLCIPIRSVHRIESRVEGGGINPKIVGVVQCINKLGDLHVSKDSVEAPHFTTQVRGQSYRVHTSSSPHCTCMKRAW